MDVNIKDKDLAKELGFRSIPTGREYDINPRDEIDIVVPLVLPSEFSQLMNNGWQKPLISQ